MNHLKLLSICIPTNGATHFVMPVLDSIYSQGVNNELFEVVITDNGKDSTLGDAIEKYKTHGNLSYYKSESTGFVNQVDAFKRSNGLFIKMLNHRAQLLPGALSDLIELIYKYKETQPVIYCSDGVLKLDEITEGMNFNTFVKKLSYYSSWSAGVGIWAKDKIMLDKISYNQMFPHASIMFETRQQSEYVIWNKKFMIMEDEPTKGGYNIFQTFAVTYLDLLKDLENKGRITSKTFKSVKKDLKGFLASWYYILFCKSNQFTFSTENCKTSILAYYSYFDYLTIILKGQVHKLIRKILGR